MDGVERIMVLGIFAVIVAILGVAAWSVTQEDLGGGSEQQQGPIALKSELPGPEDLVIGAGQTGRSVPLDRNPASGGRLPAKQPELTNARPNPQTPLTAGIEARKAGLDASDSVLDARTRDLLTEGAPKGIDRPSDGRTSIDLATRDDLAPTALRGVTTPPVKQDDVVKKESIGPRKRTHKVVEGDTLWSIASKQVSGSGSVQEKLDQVLKLNAGLQASTLLVGQTIELPGEPVVTAKSEPAKGSVRTEGSVKLYTVASGDTLSSIAKKQLGDDTRWTEIFTLNEDRMTSPSKLFVGQTLRLPQE